jgi:hypothetical protein
MVLVIDRVTVPGQLREPGRGAADVVHPFNDQLVTLTLPAGEVTLSLEQPIATSRNTDTHTRFSIWTNPG